VRVLVAACIAPFLPGGADYHIEGLVGALRQAGHEVVCLRLPFKFSPPSAIASLLGFCEGYDVSAPNGVSVDLLISLQFPAYGLTHPRHRLWLMHQHRAAYELYDEATATAAERELAVTVRAFDDRVLPMIGTRFANSRRVAERLAQFTGLSSTPLYHPPFQAERFFCAPAADYVFFPSRLETLKRQDLLIEAARHVATPVKFLLAGDGGQWSRYQSLIDSYQLGERVRLLGRITEAEKRVFYANALAVFYGPRDEDYGYVTLEAMLAGKPVITCTDSGGPLELAIDEKTALVVPPNPEAVAAAIDRLYREPAEAAAFGRAGRTHYHDLGISWARVVEQLLAA
jgi:glycosyltransferase involved in cell wall biosynthesis